jgi:hypothetical protein
MNIKQLHEPAARSSDQNWKTIMNLVYGAADPAQKSAVILNMRKRQGLEEVTRKEKEARRKLSLDRALTKAGLSKEI